MDPGPVLVEEIRDGRVQALHHGHAVHVDASGVVLEAWGEAETHAYLRSAPKPLQAIPFAEVMETFGLHETALALACASHSGEADHISLAQRVLTAAGLGHDALRCATHPAMTAHSVRADGGQEAIHNNCSGKHAGFLVACVAHEWDLDSYLDPGHPLQVRILDLLEAAIGRRPDAGTDGCGAPTFWASLTELTRIYQWLDKHDTGRRCIDAMVAHPWLVAGTGRFCTELSEASDRALVGKVGAAGLYVILHRPSGEAIAVKACDGQAEAAETVAATLAVRAGWVPENAVAHFSRRPIRDCAGRELGRFETRL